jgi:AIPR protein
VGIVQLNQLKNRITDTIAPHIDVSDVKADDQEVARLTRGLAAFALVELMGADPHDAASAVTDGFKDNGIDAVAIDAEASVVYLVQSKWSQKGKGSPLLGDVHKFIQGFRDLVNAEFGRFNEKLQSKQADLFAALNDPNVRFVLVMAHSGQDPLSDAAANAIKSLLAEVNDPIDTASFTMLSQAELHGFLVTGIHGKAPDVSVTLYDWGATQEPYAAYYGQIDASTIAEWWKKHNVRLFTQNLRQFLGDSDVNASIVQTLEREPARFWYFNNGITVLCEKVSKTPLGATGKKSGTFAFEGISIVNGAQTVGCIGRAAIDHPNQVADARVSIRFISLENCPVDFAEEVTRATNTQNRVGPREFVALDSQQERLATELALDGKRYAVKSGESAPPPDAGCTVVEATIALACAYPDSDVAVQAKREIGRLWAGAESEAKNTLYHTLFGPGLSGDRLWKTVLVLREVDASLDAERQKREGRARFIGVHGNRLIAHLVYRALPAGTLGQPATDMVALLASIPTLVSENYKRLVEIVEADYPTNYLASLFKNASRCRDIVAKV